MNTADINEEEVLCSSNVISQSQTAVVTNNAKCDCRSCRVCDATTIKFNCAGDPECTKMFHWDCYQEFILSKNKVEHFAKSKDVIACTKKHFLLAQKKGALDMIDGTRNIPWHMDGKEGKNDSNNSMSILIDWLTTPGNFNCYKGDNKTGKTKRKVCEEIAKKISLAQCKKERTANAINLKISEIINKYRKTSDWANQTGQGVLATDGAATFDEAVS